MEEIRISKLRATWPAVLDRVGKTRKPVLVTRFGNPVAQVLPRILRRFDRSRVHQSHH